MLNFNTQKAKYLISGVIIGSLLTSAVAFAEPMQKFVLEKVNYPILINGTQYNSDEQPVLNYEGNTYIPLKKIGDLLHCNINWNEELKRIEISQILNYNDTKQENTNGVIETTYKGLSAIIVNGETYFSAGIYKYNIRLKNNNNDILWDLNSNPKTHSIHIEGKQDTVIPLTDGNIIYYNGATNKLDKNAFIYYNTKFYQEY